MNRRKFLNKLASISIAGAASKIIFFEENIRADSSIQLVNGLNNVQMLHSNWARPITIPSGWNHIRFGIVHTVQDTGANLANSPTFAAGFCHGTSAILGDAAAAHTLALQTNQATWTHGTSDYNTINIQPLVIVAGSVTTGSPIFVSNSRISHDPTIRKAWLIDVTKGSPNYTINLTAANSTGIGADIPIATFLNQMPVASPSFDSEAAGSAQTLAVNEATNGLFNAINVFWDRSDAALNIAAIAVALLS